MKRRGMQGEIRDERRVSECNGAQGFERGNNGCLGGRMDGGGTGE